MSGNLPRGWVETTLGDISVKITDGTHKTPDYTQAGVPFISTSNIHPFHTGFDFTTYKRYISLSDHQELSKRCNPQKGDILISKCGTIGVSKAIDVDYQFSLFVGLALVKTMAVYVQPDFLEVMLNTPDIQKQFLACSPGSTRKTLPLEGIVPVRIPLPPLPEQHRIVSKIEELFSDLDAGVEALKKVQVQLKRYRQSVLKSAFEGKLTEKWRKEHKAKLEPASQLLERIRAERAKLANGKKIKELAPVDTSDLPGLPEGWEWTRMALLGELNRGKSKHRPRDDTSLYGGRYPFIQTGDVRNANGRITNYSQTYSERGLAQSKLWEPETLCITIAANIAETAILKIKACFPDSIVGFVANDGYCDVNYVHRYVMAIRDDLDKYAPATAQKNINLAILNDVSIPYCDVIEQHQIVSEIERRFSIADKIEKIIADSLAQSKRLRQSILKRAFEGKLVPQDPKDEPAEKLLERIKAEKAELESTKPAKRTRKQKVTL